MCGGDGSVALKPRKAHWERPGPWLGLSEKGPASESVSNSPIAQFSPPAREAQPANCAGKSSGPDEDSMGHGQSLEKTRKQAHLSRGRRPNAPQRPLTSELFAGLSRPSPAPLPPPRAPGTTHAPCGPAPCWVGLNASAGVWPSCGGGGNSGPEEGGVALRGRGDALSRRPVWEGLGLPAESLEVRALKKKKSVRVSHLRGAPHPPAAGGRRGCWAAGRRGERFFQGREGTVWKKSRGVAGCGDPRGPDGARGCRGLEVRGPLSLSIRCGPGCSRGMKVLTQGLVRVRRQRDAATPEPARQPHSGHSDDPTLCSPKPAKIKCSRPVDAPPCRIKTRAAGFQEWCSTSRAFISLALF